LLTILLLYDGKNIYEVAKIPRICERTIKELADGTKKGAILTRSKERVKLIPDEEWDKIKGDRREEMTIKYYHDRTSSP